MPYFAIYYLAVEITKASSTMPKTDSHGPFANQTVDVWTVTTPNLLYWRETLALTQRKAAEKLGLSLRTYTYYEHGEHHIPVPVLLACQYMITYPRAALRISKLLDSV